MEDFSIRNLLVLVGLILLVSIAPSPINKIEKQHTATQTQSVEKDKQAIPTPSEPAQPTLEKKPEVVPVAQEKPPEPAPVAPTPPPTPPVSNAMLPVGVHVLNGTGNCAAEIAKYDWSQSVALAVAKAESGHRPGVVNHNPNTKDYSVGCFQVNIYGANARNRPSQAELINASINVRWAYNNYKANGSSFEGQWGVCRKEVRCY